MYDGDRFFTVEDGIKKATPLFVCMVAVELSDVVFAVDSIPAVFGVTENPLVVFSSNMFAILGLRSLYPVLSKAATELKYLEPAVAVILAFIGGKMIAEYFDYAVSTELALTVIVSILGLGVGASMMENRRQEE
jgi:TerC family integral membrane protein